jgi:hypothetical protein
MASLFEIIIGENTSQKSGREHRARIAEINDSNGNVIVYNILRPQIAEDVWTYLPYLIKARLH